LLPSELSEDFSNNNIKNTYLFFTYAIFSQIRGVRPPFFRAFTLASMNLNSEAQRKKSAKEVTAPSAKEKSQLRSFSSFCRTTLDALGGIYQDLL
jgi:hypothetical protein